MNLKFDTRVMVKAAFLVAISVILTRFFAVMLPIAGIAGTLRFGFGMVPIILSGILFGPLVGGAVGLVADLIGVLVNPQGAFFIGFTLSSMLYGIIPALVYFGIRKINNKKLLHLINTVFILVCTLGTLFNIMRTSDVQMTGGQLIIDGAPANIFAFIGGIVITLLFIAIPLFMSRKNIHNDVSVSLEKVILICTVSYFIISLGLNTLWLSIMFGKGYMLLLPGRVLAGIVQIPINSLLAFVILKYLHLSPEFIKE